MSFVGGVLGFYLYSSGLYVLPAIGIWAFVVLGFGTYLYFRMFRPKREDSQDSEDSQDL